MLDWFKRKPAQAKESRAGPVMFTGKNQAQWSLGSDKIGAKKYAEEGYQKNVVAFQAINKTGDAIAAMKWIAKDARGNEVKVSGLLDLIRQPNPLQSGPEFMRALVGFFRISGNGYMERVMVGQQPRELYALRPDRMQVKPSATGFPAGYRFSVGSSGADFDADPRTGKSDIRHIKSFNPLDDWYGMSPLMAGAYAVDQHNESMQWMQSLLQNGAAPSGAMELGEGALTDDQFNRLKAEIDEKYTGSTNAGRPMLLEGGLKWTQMGLSPVDVAIIETKYSAARDVSLALGVPPLLLNIPGDSTYSNYKEARLAFYEETVIPLAEYIRDELNAWLSPLFNGVTLDIDLDKIPAIAEKRREMWAMADSSSDLTINEKREMKGYDKLPAGGDEILVSSSMIPLTMAVEPISLPPEQDPAQELTADDMKALAYGPSKTT
jgi:HK97 family phage portal protein